MKREQKGKEEAPARGSLVLRFTGTRYTDAPFDLAPNRLIAP